MKRFVHDTAITPKQGVELTEWTIANNIPLIELYAGEYIGSREMLNLYRHLACAGERGKISAVLMMREQDADLVLLRL